VTAGDRWRFALFGEPVVGVDLIDTIAVPGSPVADDLLADEDNAAAWWRLESDRVPAGDIPDIQGLRRLRSALRRAIEAVLDGAPLPEGTVADLNFFMQSVPVSRYLVRSEAGLRTETRWHHEYGGSTPLAFIATQAAEFIADPAQASRLRRCANPACWMIFVAVNPRHSWCVPGVCGNRVRVARHYRRSGA
jgi:predicted RNA-binding Zn ribbon-like protein